MSTVASGDAIPGADVKLGPVPRHPGAKRRAAARDRRAVVCHDVVRANAYRARQSPEAFDHCEGEYSAVRRRARGGARAARERERERARRAEASTDDMRGRARERERERERDSPTHTHTHTRERETHAREGDDDERDKKQKLIYFTCNL